jgi:hypothetical protein
MKPPVDGPISPLEKRYKDKIEIDAIIYDALNGVLSLRDNDLSHWEDWVNNFKEYKAKYGQNGPDRGTNLFDDPFDIIRGIETFKRLWGKRDNVPEDETEFILKRIEETYPGYIEFSERKVAEAKKLLTDNGSQLTDEMVKRWQDIGNEIVQHTTDMVESKK